MVDSVKILDKIGPHSSCFLLLLLLLLLFLSSTCTVFL